MVYYLLCEVSKCHFKNNPICMMFELINIMVLHSNKEFECDAAAFRDVYEDVQSRGVWTSLLKYLTC